MAADSVSQWMAQTQLIDVDSMTGLNTPTLAEPIVFGVLRRGHTLMITGPSKAGKTWTMIMLAYAVASGTEWLGFKCNKGTVCYVDTEMDTNSLLVRFDTVRAKMGLSNSCGNLKVISLRGQTVTAESLVNTLIDAYGDDMPSLVIVDSIYSIESGDENSAGDMRGMMMQLERITVEGTALAFTHHHAKGNAGARNVIDRGSGSGVFGRFVDAMIDLTPTVPDDEQEGMLHARYGERSVPLRMSFVLREFADPGNRDVVFDFPLMSVIDGDWMKDAPEAGTAMAGRVMGAKANKSRVGKKWTALDEEIGRAVNSCIMANKPPTRANVAPRMTWNDKPVGLEQLKRWTVGDASTRWRTHQTNDGWVLYDTDAE